MNQQLLTKLVEQWFDNTISDSDLTCLKVELLANKDALAHYVDLTEIHSLLSQTEAAALPQSNVIPMERIVRRQRRKTVRIATFAAAALIMIGVMVMTVLIVPEKQHGLTFDISPSTQFTLTHSSIGDDTPTGMTMEEGSHLVLTQGTVELTFGTGVKSIVMAPADMSLHGDNQLYLNRGTAWFHVPEGAEGFQVTTQNLKVVDLGTEFGVITNTDDQDEVHVFKGTVEVTSLRYPDEFSELTAGQARSYDLVGYLEEIECAPKAFLSALPSSLPYLHWSFDGEKPFQAEGSLPEIDTITTWPIQSDSRPAIQRIVAGKNDKALSFDGSGDHLLTNWFGILGNQPRSVACWIKIHPNDPNGWSSVAEWGHLQNKNYWRFRIAGVQGKAVIRIGLGDHWYDGSNDLADGQWHHIACVDTGKTWQPDTPTIKFYIDGIEELAVQQKPSSDERRKTLEGLPMIIGTNHAIPGVSNKSFLHGKIDELFIFQGALSEESIRSLMITHRPD
jgi:hypothetical protein